MAASVRPVPFVSICIILLRLFCAVPRRCCPVPIPFTSGRESLLEKQTYVRFRFNRKISTEREKGTSSQTASGRVQWWRCRINRRTTHTTHTASTVVSSGFFSRSRSSHTSGRSLLLATVRCGSVPFSQENYANSSSVGVFNKQNFYPQRLQRQALLKLSLIQRISVWSRRLAARPRVRPKKIRLQRFGQGGGKRLLP